ncbi:MAG: hypothetical protein EOM20_01595 [Spartobacteria bacterium]|nr:hypothetical protein [Spartobacteria bacterium]
MTELYARELLDKGHTEQACAYGLKLRTQKPELGADWSLSLQLRLGLIDRLTDCLADETWLSRLRDELVSPEDVLYVSEGQLAQQAQAIMQAWNAMETGRPDEALAQLRTIGRHSPLADWRLFLDMLQAERSNQPDHAEAAFKRIRPGTPACLLAQTLRGEAPSSQGHLEAIVESPGASQLAALLSAFQQKVAAHGFSRALMPALDTVVQLANKQHRPGLALAIICASMREGEMIANYPVSDMINHFIKWKPLTLSHMIIRSCRANRANEFFSAEEYYEIADEFGFTAKEKAMILLYGVKQHQRTIICNQPGGLRRDFPDEDSFEEELMFDELCEIAENCNMAARLDPGLRELYRIWDWVDETGNMTCEAAEAYHRAWPNEPEALILLCKRTIQLGMFDKARPALQKLRMLPGTSATAEELEQTLIYTMTRAAYEDGEAGRVEELGSAYHGHDLFERVYVAACRWLAASNNKDRRERGLDMVALNSPWLVYFICEMLEQKSMLNSLPAALKRALNDNPGDVLRGLTALLKHAKRDIFLGLNSKLYSTLTVALANPATDIQVLREACIAMLNANILFIFRGDEEDAVRMSLRLLQKNEEDQALGLLMRATLASQCFYCYNKKAVEKVLITVWNMAPSHTMRSLLETCSSKFFDNMIQFERKQSNNASLRILKTQQKIKTLNDFRKHFSQKKNPFRFDISLSDVLRAGQKIFEDPEYDMDFDPDFEMPDFPEPPSPPHPLAGLSPDVDLAKSHPATFMEFEVLVYRVSNVVNESKKVSMTQELVEMIRASITLSDKSKVQLLELCAKLLPYREQN